MPRSTSEDAIGNAVNDLIRTIVRELQKQGVVKSFEESLDAVSQKRTIMTIRTAPTQPAPAKCPKRRKPGTGVIRFKKDREKPWETEFKPSTGKMRYDAFATKQEAGAHLDKLMAEQKRAAGST